MHNNKMLLGVYDNPDTTYDVTKSLVESGYDVHDVYTPFAVHNLDKVIQEIKKINNEYNI